MRDTILWGSAVSLTAVPSSSVRVVGKAGAALGLGVAVAAGSIEPVGAADVATDGDAPVAQADRVIASATTVVAMKR